MSKDCRVDIAGLEGGQTQKEAPPTQESAIVSFLDKCEHECNTPCDQLEPIAQALREAQVGLFQARESFFQFYHESPVGYVALNKEGVIAHCNKTFAGMLGVVKLKILGRPFVAFLEQSEQKGFRARYNAFYKNPEGKQFELPICTFGNDQLYSMVHGRKIDGALLSMENTCAQSQHGEFLLCTVIDITRQKSVEEEISKLAFYDQLTGLANRRMLLDRLQLMMSHSQRNRHYLALLFLDLDRFKEINDSLGHAIGDDLLVEVGKRLQKAVRQIDVVARLGGDEFVVLLTDLGYYESDAAQKVEIIAEKIRVLLSTPYLMNGFPQYSSASIGVSIFSGSKYSMDDVISQADTAMYVAKNHGKNRVAFFQDYMNTKIGHGLGMERNVRKAASAGQFVPYYQVQVDSDRNCIAAEALLRWTDPIHQAVGPDQFVPILEELGLIENVWEKTLRHVCECSKQWNHQLGLSINLSPVLLSNRGFFDRTREILDEMAYQPETLTFEVTEGSLMQDIDKTIQYMKKLKDIGIRFSIDDFGTGYSSLAYLKKLPIDELKIDRRFIEDIVNDDEDQVIVNTIIAMAKQLGLVVVAEGVETDLQFQFLEDRGCDLFQGFLFSRALSSELVADHYCLSKC